MNILRPGPCEFRDNPPTPGVPSAGVRRVHGVRVEQGQRRTQHVPADRRQSDAPVTCVGARARGP